MKKKRNFNPAVWSKPRYQFSYERRSNLFLKNAQEIRFDFRNTIEILFTVKRREERSILAVGGSGGSGQRESNTLFTAVYYLLGKKKPLRHHLIKYNGHNEFEYFRSYRKVLLTNGFGSNYDLDKDLMLEIRRAGIDAYRIPEIKKSG